MLLSLTLCSSRTGLISLGLKKGVGVSYWNWGFGEEKYVCICTLDTPVDETLWTKKKLYLDGGVAGSRLVFSPAPDCGSSPLGRQRIWGRHVQAAPIGVRQ